MVTFNRAEDSSPNLRGFSMLISPGVCVRPSCRAAVGGFARGSSAAPPILWYTADMTIKLNIAEEFTSFPIGRYRDDSNLSGEVFREDILIPALRRAAAAGVVLEVDFTGMESLNCSFLEEGFGGAVRTGEWTAEQVLGLIRFVPDNDLYAIYIKDAKDYIREAGEK